MHDSLVRDPGATRHGRWHEVWHQLGGGRAENELLLGLGATLQAGHHVLDAGCGTGAIARHVHWIQPASRVTIVDLPTTPRLAFADASFDVVVCAWALEVVPDAHRAMADLVRVLAPGGCLFACFRTVPDGLLARASAMWSGIVARRGLAGHPLRHDQVPLPHLPTLRVSRFAGGRTTLVWGST